MVDSLLCNVITLPVDIAVRLCTVFRVNVLKKAVPGMVTMYNLKMSCLLLKLCMEKHRRTVG